MLSGLLIVSAIAAVDALTGGAVLLTLVLIGPLLSSVRSGPRGVTLVSAYAVAAAVLLGIADHFFLSGDHLVRVAVVTTGSVLAIWTARIRQEREKAAELLAAQAAVARILMSADTLAEATPKILAAIGETLDWQLGAIWSVRRHTGAMACEATWRAPGVEAEEFERKTREITLAPGEGLPGRVWRSGQPSWVLDVPADANFPRALAAAESGLHAGFAFPIRSAGQILGVIEFFSSETRQPDHRLLDLMEALGGQLGEYIEHKLAEEAVRNSEARKAAMLESALDSILTMDHDGRIVEFNPAAERVFGYSAAEAVGAELCELIVPPHLRERHRAGLARYLRTGESQILDRRIELTGMRRDGSEFPVELTVTRIGLDPPLFTGYIRDMTEQKRAQEQVAELLQLEQDARVRTQQAERRASFLAEAQALLSSSLDYETTFRNLARLSVPYLADWCVIDLVAQDGGFERVAVAHVDPAKERLVSDLESNYPTDPDSPRGAPNVVRSGRSELWREIPSQLIDETATDEEHRRILGELGLRSAMVVPLRARDRTLGAITLVSAESGRQFGDQELALAEDLAVRAAIAADNARLYGERSYIASTLQQSLMPEHLPEIPGVELSARYLAAGEGNEVGGDFYDIYRAGESTWGIAIGDVRGKGPRAAAVTALARYSLRTASLSETVPSSILRTLNEAMLRQRTDDRFCTVAYASIRPRDGGRMEVRLAIGGHPLPLLLRQDGSVTMVGSPGTLLGFVPDPDIVDETLELHSGESLILYTDGVSEARSRDGLFGEARLIELVRSCGGLDAGEIAERIERAVLEFQEVPQRDDLAVLVLRVREERSIPATLKARRAAPVRQAPA
jgi:PAS domain S-box-containing protein